MSEASTYGSKSRRGGREPLQGGAGAVCVQGLKRVDVGRDEGWLIDQVPEQLAVGDEGRAVRSLPGCDRLEGVSQSIHHRYRLALLVDALRVSGPAGHHRRGKANVPASGYVLIHRPQHEFRNPVRRFRAESGDRVSYRTIREPLDQRPLVRVKVNTRHWGERWSRLTIHVLEQEVREEPVLRDFVHESVAGQIPEIAHRLMAGIEQTKLHQFVRLDIGDHLDTDVFQGWSAGRKVVFKHPLGERLADDRPVIFDPETLADLFPIFVGSHRSD